MLKARTRDETMMPALFTFPNRILFGEGSRTSLAEELRGTGLATMSLLPGSVETAMLDGSWERLKACRNCHWSFYDYSPNRSATWCSMQLCGNRKKTRAYRRRRAKSS